MIISLLVAIPLPDFPALDVVHCHLTNGSILHVPTEIESIKDITFLLLPLPPAC